jgi:hypothetical protein
MNGPPKEKRGCNTALRTNSVLAYVAPRHNATGKFYHAAESAVWFFFSRCLACLPGLSERAYLRRSNE